MSQEKQTAETPSGAPRERSSAWRAIMHLSSKLYESGAYTFSASFGLILGPIIFVLVRMAPLGLTPEQHTLAAIIAMTLTLADLDEPDLAELGVDVLLGDGPGLVLGQLVHPPDVGEDALFDPAVLAGVLDDLQVAALAGGFGAEEHRDSLICHQGRNPHAAHQGRCQP